MNKFEYLVQQQSNLFDLPCCSLLPDVRFDFENFLFIGYPLNFFDVTIDNVDIKSNITKRKIID